ncbi:MAG: thioredoxin domain-containing protein [Elusimicrobia bacterium]|nr:thioredoxin domain-containing protein [Elusimicrobiota bacterium]
MTDKKILYRKIFAGLAIMFLSTLAALFLRSSGAITHRPAPEFRTKGPADAKIVIEEFTDFACPACKEAGAHLEKIAKIYEGKIRIIFKHNPLLSIHPYSMDAAVFSDCAGRQGKFWEYAKVLFENQQEWSRAQDKNKHFLSYAERFKLDEDSLKNCVRSEDAARAVKMDLLEGKIRNIDATPTFFINGKRAVGSGQLLEQAKLFDGIANR